MFKTLYKELTYTKFVALFFFFLIFGLLSQKISPLTNSVVTAVKNLNAPIVTNIPFYSKDIEATVSVPSDWKTEEVITFVSFTSPEGKIELRRNPTNFTTLEEYMKANDLKRSIKGEQGKKLTVAGYPAIQRMEEFNGIHGSKEKIYYLYVNKWIYTIYTNDQPLFDDLDKVTYSFKYTP